MTSYSPAVTRTVSRVIPLERPRWVGFSHVEADECGGLNALLAAAPHAAPVSSRVGAMVQVTDLADRAPHALDRRPGGHRSREQRPMTPSPPPSVPYVE